MHEQQQAFSEALSKCLGENESKITIFQFLLLKHEYLEDQHPFLGLSFYFDLIFSVSVSWRYTSCKNNIIIIIILFYCWYTSNINISNITILGKPLINMPYCKMQQDTIVTHLLKIFWLGLSIKHVLLMLVVVHKQSINLNNFKVMCFSQQERCPTFAWCWQFYSFD